MFECWPDEYYGKCKWKSLQGKLGCLAGCWGSRYYSDNGSLQEAGFTWCEELWWENFSSCHVPDVVAWITGLHDVPATGILKAESRRNQEVTIKIEGKVLFSDFGDMYCQSALRPDDCFAVFLKEVLNMWFLDVKICSTLLCLSRWHQLRTQMHFVLGDDWPLDYMETW